MTGQVIQFPTPKENNLVRKPKVLKQFGFSNTTLTRLIKGGYFPAPIKIGLRAVAWLQSDIDAFIERQKAERA